MLHYFPKYFTTKAIALYIIVLMVISVAFGSYGMSWIWILFGLVEVTAFFYFTNILTKRWAEYSEQTFLQQLFIAAVFAVACAVRFRRNAENQKPSRGDGAVRGQDGAGTDPQKRQDRLSAGT